MAGVLLHLAMGDPDKTDTENTAYTESFKKAYTLGLLLPDIAKQNMIENKNDFDMLFDGCDSRDHMTYEEYLAFSCNHHFSPDVNNPGQQDTRNPDLSEFLNAEYVDIRKPVWQGVLCHLMGDRAFYHKAYCTDDPRAMADYEKEVGAIEVWDIEKWHNSRTGQIYYNDYDVLNQRIEDEYHVLHKASAFLSGCAYRQLLASFHVKFASAPKEPVYMNLANITKYIAASHRMMREMENGVTEEILNCFSRENLDRLFEAA